MTVTPMNQEEAAGEHDAYRSAAAPLTRNSDCEPFDLARSLVALETDLRERPNETAPAFAPREIHALLERARAWAARHGFSVECIPEASPAGASTEECLATLRCLAEILRELRPEAPERSDNGSVPSHPEKTMREVVKRLHNENAEALLELKELSYTLCEMLRHLEALHGALRQLHADVAAILLNDENPDGLAALCNIEESSDRASSSAEQIALSFRQICVCIKTWNAIDAGDA